MKPLRKRHLQIWTTLAVLLPVGIVMAYINVPGKITSDIFQPAKETVLPKVIHSVEKKSFAVAIRTNDDQSQWQLEWINKEASVYPSALIYKVNNEKQVLQDAELIGRIESRGTYYFPLRIDSTRQFQFILYDIIHRQQIDFINLKP